MNTSFELPLDAQARMRMWADSQKATPGKPVPDGHPIELGRRGSGVRPENRAPRPRDAN